MLLTADSINRLLFALILLTIMCVISCSSRAYRIPLVAKPCFSIYTIPSTAALPRLLDARLHTYIAHASSYIPRVKLLSVSTCTITTAMSLSLIAKRHPFTGAFCRYRSSFKFLHYYYIISPPFLLRQYDILTLYYSLIINMPSGITVMSKL